MKRTGAILRVSGEKDKSEWSEKMAVIARRNGKSKRRKKEI